MAAERGLPQRHWRRVFIGAPAQLNPRGVDPDFECRAARDGQTTQYVAATDPVTGQVVKIDATLNLQK